MTNAAKPKVAFYWCSSCGGCEEAIIDLDEQLLDIVATVEIVFWPCAMDFKTSDIRALADQEIAVTFINGAIRTSEQEEMVKLLREKSQLVIAFGMCAYQGGIPALANLTTKQAILNRAYLEAESLENPEQTLPVEETKLQDHKLTIPHFYETVFKLKDVIPVDYSLPGCPPTPTIINDALQAILTDTLPEPGAVLAKKKSLCTTCSRNETKPEDLTIPKLYRVHQIEIDPVKCFLAQGILCMGPATRDGCDERCINGNMPCTGCFGPLTDMDQGAKMVASIGGVAEAEDNEPLQSFVQSIADPAGTFYRYGLSASLLGKKRKENRNE